MKILNYVELIDSVRNNNQKIRKSSGTVRRDKIELVRMSSVRKFHCTNQRNRKENETVK